VTCVSTESARQMTLYVPGGSGGSETRISVRSLASTCLSLRATCLPSRSVTRSVLNAGSSSCVNQTCTCGGAVCTTEPTRGEAWSRKACAAAACANIVRTSAAAARRNSENRLAKAGREEGVDEEVHLEQQAGVAAGAVVDRNDGLDCELHVAASPDDARVDRAGVGRRAAVHRLLQIELDERDQLVERLAQAHVLHERLQVRQAVLDGEAELEDVRMLRDRGVAVLVERRFALLAGNGIAHAARERERAQVLHAVRKVAEAFSDEE